MKKIFFVTSVLPLVHGGRTKSLLQRARIFTDHNMVVKIYTTNYNENYEPVYRGLRKNKKVNNKIEMENIYEYYKGSPALEIKNYKKFIKTQLNRFGVSSNAKKSFFDLIINIGDNEKKEESSNIYKFKKVADSHVTYYYQDGRTLYHLSKNKETDKIKNIDFYLPYYNKSVMRAYTDRKENIHKVTYFEPGTDMIQSEVFVDKQFHPYIVKEYSYKNGDKKLNRIILTRRNGDTNVFKTEKEFFKFWFEEIFSDGDIVINDARLLDKPLLETNKNIKRIFQLHNPHLENPIDANSDVKKSFRTLFQYELKETDIIVSLTEAQKQNILKKHPELNENIVVIPHSITPENIKYPLNSKQICIVARLAPQKNLQDAIEAYSLFNEQIKGYSLVIYGEGEEEAKLQKLIDEKGLEAHVKLMGVTNNPDKVFQESLFSVMSSIHEGFPLSTLESIANGCPSVSYDVMWGPAELLDEKSGRVTKTNTPEALCQEMLAEIEHPRDRNAVRERAMKFSVETFYHNWSQLLDNKT